MNTNDPPQGSRDLRIFFEIDPLAPVRVLERTLKRFPQTGKRINRYLQEGPCTCGQCKPWPKWCLLPASCFGHIVTDEMEGKESLEAIHYHMIELATLATWRYSQGIYRFHPFLLMEILQAPFAGPMPVERFHHMPQWSVYVDTPNMNWFGEALHGFWGHLAWDSIRDVETLVFLLDKGNGLEVVAVETGPWSVREGIQRIDDEAREYCLKNNISPSEPKYSAEETATALAPLVSMLLYLCSETAEIEHEHTPGLRPANPQPKKTRHGLKMFPPAQPTFWRVGKAAGALLG